MVDTSFNTVPSIFCSFCILFKFINCNHISINLVVRRIFYNTHGIQSKIHKNDYKVDIVLDRNIFVRSAKKRVFLRQTLPSTSAPVKQLSPVFEIYFIFSNRHVNLSRHLIQLQRYLYHLPHLLLYQVYIPKAILKKKVLITTNPSINSTITSTISSTTNLTPSSMVTLTSAILPSDIPFEKDDASWVLNSVWQLMITLFCYPVESTLVRPYCRGDI